MTKAKEGDLFSSPARNNTSPRAGSAWAKLRRSFGGNEHAWGNTKANQS
jgi:hypothetical protein